MGTLLLSEFKKKASGFLQEKYKTARLALTDVTAAELLTEEAINSDPWGPDAKTMTRIAEASFDVDDYWRIVDVLHKRLYDIDWNQWRQAYKALVLLEFLITHGPEDFAEEFHCDADVIRELGTLKHIDGKGFDWGASMQKKSERILKLLLGGEPLQEARLKALKITKEIKGFGNLMLSTSPSSSSSSSPTPSSSRTDRSSSFGSVASGDSPSWRETEELHKHDRNLSMDLIDLSPRSGLVIRNNCRERNNHIKAHLWDTPIEESGSLIDAKEVEDEDDNQKDHKPNGIFGGRGTFKSLSDVGRAIKKKVDRQLSNKY